MKKWSELNVRVSRKRLPQNFSNPPDEFRPVPWLCYTGSLKKDRIHRAIAQMHAKGIRSFFIYAIYGMEVPYLSGEWFKIVEDTCAYCRAKKMTVWLCDDYNWPSGSCAGMLLARHPEYNFRALTACFSEEVPPGKTVALAYEGDIWQSYACRRNSRYRSVEVQMKTAAHNGKKRAIWLNDSREKARLCLVVNKASTRNDVANRGSLWLMDSAGKGYTDFLNARAAQEFIAMTHAHYFRRLKRYFGTVLKGFFIDEPGIYGLYNNVELFEEFRNCQGYDLRDHIPELFLPEHPNRYRVRADFRKVMGQRFGREFIGRINAWCREHSVDSTGHFLGEESLENEVTLNGDPWLVRKEMSVPGLDLLACRTNYEIPPAWKESAGSLWYPDPAGLILTVKHASAAARYLSMPRVMAEAYGVMPYSVAPVDLTMATHWLTALGTNFINDNTLTLSFEGFRKRVIAGRHFTTPWWEYYKDFAEFAGRCSVMSAAGTLDAKIGVLYPVLTGQCLTPIGPAHPEDEKLVRQTTCTLQQTAEALLRAHWDWEIIFEQVLEQGKIRNGQLKLPNSVFSVVIIPAAHVLSMRVIEKLEQFACAGGIVVFVGVLPSISIEKGLNIKKRMAALLKKKKVYHVSSDNAENWMRLKPELDAIMKAHLKPPLVLQGNGHDEILTAHRRAGKRDIFHLVNMSSRPLSVAGDFACQDTLDVWHPDDGKCYQVKSESEAPRGKPRGIFAEPCEVTPWRTKKGKGHVQSIKLEFAPWEGFYLVSAPGRKRPALKKIRPGFLNASGYASIGFPDFEWQVRRHRPNMAPLKQWVRLDPDNKGLAEGWHTGAPDRNWTPTAQDILPFKMNPEDSKFIWIKTVFKAECLPSNLAVVVDGRDFSEAYLNGRRLAPPQPYTLWDEANLKFDLSAHGGARTGLTDKAKQGWNVLSFKVPISPYYHGKISLPFFGQNVVEPVVLIGDFYGIKDVEGRLIIRPENEVLHIGPWAAQGLPGYAGAITYRQDLTLNDRLKQAWLDLGNVQVAAEVAVNKKSVGRRCWPPYTFEVGPYLKQGKNRFEIKVTNSLGGLLGTIGWRSLTRVSEPESGLLGPVRLYVN